MDEVVTVSNDELCGAIKLIYDDTRSITEPSGALAVAGIRKYVAERGVRGQTLVAVNSGRISTLIVCVMLQKESWHSVRSDLKRWVKRLIEAVWR